MAKKYKVKESESNYICKLCGFSQPFDTSYGGLYLPWEMENIWRNIEKDELKKLIFQDRD